jgi:hypothetical protein
LLARCGFAKTAELIDPEEGPIWRWEHHHEETPDNAHDWGGGSAQTTLLCAPQMAF